MEMDLETERFIVKIADLGYAREFKKDNEEIEFELNCYGPDNFEVTKIEKLRPGSLMFEFKTDLDNQDRDQGIILRMPESGPSGQPGKIEYRNNADACQYLDFEMEDIIPLKTISIRVSKIKISKINLALILN